MVRVRAAALTSFDQVARFLALDPDKMLRSAGLDASVFAQPDRPLAVATVAELLEKAARLSGCEHFGLLMAEARSLASIGPVSLVLMHQARVSDVIIAIVRHQHLFGHALQLSLQTIDGAVLMRVELAGVPLARQGSELVVAYFCQCISAVLGRRWSPESVSFIHSAPKDLRGHRRFFACPVYFDSEFNGVVCAPEALDEQNPAANQELAAHAERMLTSMMPEPPVPDACELVKRSLRLLLPEHRGSTEDVARNLCMSPRSLQRALEREGQSFGAMLTEVRREFAERYLAASHPVGVVASLSGFERASSFTRWFTGEFGMPPSAWRQRMGL